MGRGSGVDGRGRARLNGRGLHRAHGVVSLRCASGQAKLASGVGDEPSGVVALDVHPS